jgi:hypothetical protein
MEPLDTTQEVADTALEANVPDPSTSTDRPIPGMSILDSVLQEVILASKDRQPPAYLFVRIDTYLLTLTRTGVGAGPIRVVDEDNGVDCILLPLLPGTNQSPFILAYTDEEAEAVYRASYPPNTFRPIAPAPAGTDT